MREGRQNGEPVAEPVRRERSELVLAPLPVARLTLVGVRVAVAVGRVAEAAGEL